MSEIEIVGSLLDHYTMVPNEIGRTPGLKSRAVHVYVNLRSHRSGWKTNIRNVAESTGLSNNTVMAAINDLIDFGYIERITVPGKGGKFATYKYRVFDRPCLTFEDRPDVSQKVRQEPVSKTDTAPVSKSKTLKKTISKKTNKEHSPYSPPEGDGASEDESALIPFSDSFAPTPKPNPNGYTDAFEDWWKRWPKRTSNKKRAFAQWKEAIKRVPLDVLNERTDALRSFVEAGHKEIRYVRDAERWLRDDQWEDELVPEGRVQHPGHEGIPRGCRPLAKLERKILDGEALLEDPDPLSMKIRELGYAPEGWTGPGWQFPQNHPALTDGGHTQIERSA